MTSAAPALTVVLVVFLTATAIAAVGDLDTTYGGDGAVSTDFTTGDHVAAAIAIQVDGQIIVAGLASQRFALARYDADGSLDATFGGDGRVKTRFARGRHLVNALAIQPDGRIVAVGILRPTGEDARWALARYDSDGSLDTSFNGDGKLALDLTTKDDYARGRPVLLLRDRMDASGRTYRPLARVGTKEEGRLFELGLLRIIPTSSDEGALLPVGGRAPSDANEHIHSRLGVETEARTLTSVR